jgi:hypothetical protein
MVPELPHAMARRLQESHGLSRTIAEVLMMIGSERIDHLADVGCGVRYFEAAMDASSSEVEGKTMANWSVFEKQKTDFKPDSLLINNILCSYYSGSSTSCWAYWLNPNCDLLIVRSVRKNSANW